MISGTRPALHISRVRKFKHVYGGTASFPDFNLDAGISNPNQDADGAPTECVGYTIADILTDIFRKEFSPDFSYAAARWITKSGAGTDGTSFHAGMEGAVWIGAALKGMVPFAAQDRGELFVSDFANYMQSLKADAASFAQNGLRNVLGMGDNFSSIVSAAFSGRIDVSLGSPWFKEWQNLPNGSVLPMPNSPSLQAQSAGTPWHNYAGKGQKTLNSQPMLIVKAWTGGFMYMPRDVANVVFSLPGTGALTFDPKAIHWLSDLGILLERGIIPGAH